MSEILDVYFFLQELHNALYPASGFPTKDDDVPHRSHLLLRWLELQRLHREP